MKSFNPRYFLLIIPMLALIILIGYRFYGDIIASAIKKLPTQSKKKSKSAKIDIIQGVRKVYSQQFDSYGNLEAVAKVDIFTTVESRLTGLYKDVSKKVRKGDLLVQLDDKELREKVKQKEAVANVMRATARQDTILARHKKIIYDRAMRAYIDKIIPEQELDDSKTSYEVARAQSTLSQARVREAEAAINEVYTRLKETKIYSPIDGVVSERYLDAGSLVRLGQPVFTIISVDELKLLVHLPEQKIHQILDSKGKLKENIQVKAHVEALKQSFKGVIYRIYPTIDTNTRTVKVDIRLDNSSGILKPGYYCRVDFNIADNASALFLKRKAMRFDEVQKKYYVQVVDGGILRQKVVEIIDYNEQEVIITKGITESSRVIYPYQSRLENGSKIPDGDKKTLP